VQSCPGWLVGDVVRHTGAVYGRVLAGLVAGRTPTKGEWATRPGPDQDLLDWFEDRRARLAAWLAGADPEAPAWTWAPVPGTVAFWCRRMAAETAVHRVDVQAAGGRVDPLGDELAADMVGEVLTVFLAGARDAGEPVGGTVAVRTAGQAWRVDLGVVPAVVGVGAGPADAAVTGEPSEVALWLWGRRPDDAVRVSGSRAAGEALRGRLAAATS